MAKKAARGGGAAKGGSAGRDRGSPGKKATPRRSLSLRIRAARDKPPRSLGDDEPERRRPARRRRR